MTSKISFSSLRRENTKHRIGMIAVVLLCFIIYIIGFIMSVQNIYYSNENANSVLREITALSEPETVLGIISICAGVILAASAFRYLHSKVEVDFYHSLPIKRRDMLFVTLTNDFLFYFISITVTMLLRCVVVACVGCFGKMFFVNTVSSVICYFAVYLAAYLLMTFAMLMTGNTFTAFLGFGVLASYFPVFVRNLYPVLAETFFKTYCTQSQWGKGFEYLSPVSVGFKLLWDFDTWTWARHIKTFGVLCIWILLLLAADYILSEKRKSEMAGKSMAFPGTKPAIRILIVVPMAIYTGIILANLSIDVRREWIIIGIVIGTAIFHGIIECIYRLDVRGLWAHKKQMIFSMCASLLIVGFFWLDLGGYDSFLPDKSEVNSIVINTPYMGTGDDYYWGKERSGVTGETLEKVLATMDKAVNNNDKNSGNYNDGEAGYNLFAIKYRMKNGKEINRCYVLDKKLQSELMSEVFDDEQYKKDTYSLYTADWSVVESVSLSFPVEYRNLDITKEQRAELFRIYLEELTKLNYDTAKNMLPCGQLSVEHLSNNDIYSGVVDYYDIYPTFKKTIAYIRDELEIDMSTSMKDFDIHKIVISEYNEDTDEDEEYVVRDQNVIESVKDSLCFIEEPLASSVINSDMAEGSIWAEIRTENGNQEVSLYTTSETIQKLKKSADKE
ncbi:MAG: DUF6449 domain-containing protein [Lachnospiraceae bacterium]